MATEVMTAPEGRIIHKTYAVLSGAAIPQRVHVTQYDESLPVIACTLYKDGQLYTIPDGASVRMRMNKNGLPVYHEAMGIDDARNVVYLEITAQMTVLYGEFAMVLEVETSDGKTAGTSYLRLIVRQNPVQNPELDNIPDYTANSNRLTAEGVKKLQDESSTQQKAIEDKGKNTLESIPADYSALSGKVDENTSGISELKGDIKNTVGDYNTLEKYFKYKMLKGSNKIMRLKSDVVAPYDDLNTLPIGEIVVFGAFADWDIKNYPNDFSGGTVVTLNFDNGDKLGAVQFVVSPSNLFAYRIYWGDTNKWHSWNVAATLAITDKIENIEVSYYATLGLFQTFGVIGDSYASGVLGQYGNIPHYGISWGQILARRNGNVCVNFSYGGLSTRTWLTHEKGLTLLQNESAKQLYICDLARNDTALGDSYIGTIADIESGADTYYGNYGKIIKAIKNKNSNAKIILLIAPEIRESFKVAIRNIAQNFNIPSIECSDDTFFTTRYVEYKKVGHPVATEYSGMALAIERLFSDCVGKYHTYFEDYRFDD